MHTHRVGVFLGKNWQDEPDVSLPPHDILSDESLLASTAVRLMLKHELIDTAIISTGQTRSNIQDSESHAMCVAAGLDPAKDPIILEERSKDTYENAREVQKLLQAILGQTGQQIDTNLVTVDFHMLRSRLLFWMREIGADRYKSAQSVIAELGSEREIAQSKTYDSSVMKEKRIQRERIGWGINFIPHGLRKQLVRIARGGSKNASNPYTDKEVQDLVSYRFSDIA